MEVHHDEEIEEAKVHEEYSPDKPRTAQPPTQEAQSMERVDSINDEVKQSDGSSPINLSHGEVYQKEKIDFSQPRYFKNEDLPVSASFENDEDIKNRQKQIE